MMRGMTAILSICMATGLAVLSLSNAAGAQFVGDQVAALSPAVARDALAGPSTAGLSIAEVSPPVIDDEAVRRYLVGWWESQSQVAGRLVTVRVRFQPDGSFSAVTSRKHTTSSAAGAGEPESMNGRWRIRPLGGDRYVLTLQVAEPRAHELTSSFRIVDGDTIRDEHTGVIGRRVEE